MKKLQVITNSEQEAFRTCTQRHGFAYVDLLRPKDEGLPLLAGGIFHAGVEAGWRAAWSDDPKEGGGPGWESLDVRLDRAISASFARVHEATTEAVAKLEVLGDELGKDPEEKIAELEEAAEANAWGVEHYFRCAKPDLEFLPVIIEGPFSVRVRNANRRLMQIQREGIMDLVLWDVEANRLVLQDHKNTRLPVAGLAKKLPLDTQLTGYLEALRELQRRGDLFLGEHTTKLVTRLVRGHGNRIRGAWTGSVGFNVVRRQMPASPRVNKLTKKAAVSERQQALLDEQQLTGVGRGEVSVAPVDTLASFYADALEAQVIDRELPITDKQRLVLESLQNRGDTFFAQHEFFRGEEEIERWRHELVTDARRIRELKRNPTLRTRNPGACAMPWSPPCPYANLCMAPNDPLVKKGFRVVEEPHEELEQKRNGSKENDEREDDSNGYEVEGPGQNWGY